MATERKAILSAGLGRFAALDPNGQARFGPDAGAKARELLEISIKKANAAGFDLVTVDVNTQDYEDSMKRITETLQSREFVGINVGFGVRGHKEHTVLFEKILNQSVATTPGIKIMFSNGPDDVITAIQRNFPEAF